MQCFHTRKLLIKEYSKNHVEHNNKTDYNIDSGYLSNVKSHSHNDIPIKLYVKTHSHDGIKKKIKKKMKSSQKA